MRIRTAKQRAERIDLYYFKRSQGLRRWRILLSIALPVVALAWIAGVAAAGSRTPYSAGPLSRSHAFVETRCQVCHSTATRAGSAAAHGEYAEPFFRRHTTDGACLTCHDAPAHATNQTATPGCSTCHLDHRGRVDLARVDSRFCIDCHGDLKTTRAAAAIVTEVRGFPSGHPEFAAVRDGAHADPARVKFNHALHMKDTLTGPNGPERLECATCHRPEGVRASASVKKPGVGGLMVPITYRQQCARCHPLFFDERLDREAPHDTPENVRAFVRQTLASYIQRNPSDLTRREGDVRRVPLNFPRPVEPPARTPQEWVARRAAFDERLLWDKTCAECHESDPARAAGLSGAVAGGSGLPIYEKTNITKQWMPRAAFDHTLHSMLTCDSCHAARGSTKTSDVLLPKQAACATCHAPSARAESGCFECHRYHDWTKMQPVSSPYTLTDFK
jgi:hypothetical protein